MPSNAEAVDTVATTGGGVVTHGIEVAVEFKPVERPAEPLDYDQPIQCPLPEPSILNVSYLISTLILCLYIHTYIVM